MRTYQSVLPGATRKSCPPTKSTLETIGAKIKASIATILQEGFWYCHHCQARCERIEGEQGQPAHCERCSSPRIEYCPPLQAIDRVYLEPQDLA